MEGRESEEKRQGGGEEKEVANPGRACP